MKSTFSIWRGDDYTGRKEGLIWKKIWRTEEQSRRRKSSIWLRGS